MGVFQESVWHRQHALRRLQLIPVLLRFSRGSSGSTKMVTVVLFRSKRRQWLSACGSLKTKSGEQLVVDSTLVVVRRSISRTSFLLWRHSNSPMKIGTTGASLNLSTKII